MTSSEHKPHQEPDTLKLARIISGDRTVDGNGQWSALDAIAVAEAYRSLFEQYQALRAAAELIVPSGKFTLVGPYEYVRADDIIALRDALRLGDSNPAKSPDSYEVVDHTEAREDYHKEYME